MFVDFSSISEDAKIWIYPSSRKFYDSEKAEIENLIQIFIENWKAEDENFKASYRFLYNRFVIFCADDSESKLSNSDINVAVSFILELQEKFDVMLLDKMNVCFKQGEFVQYKELKDFKQLVKNKAVTGKSIVFDNLITTKFDFENYWEITMEESWYNRFL